MCDNEENKRIYFLDNLFDCRPPYKQNHLKEKNYHNIQIAKLLF